MTGTDHPIKRWRLAQKPPLDLAGMAALVPCSIPYLWKIENGEGEPSVEFVRKLVAATSSAVTADAIVFWKARDACPAA